MLECAGFANGGELIDTAELSYGKKEYYNAITELMRFQFLFPGDARYPESMVLMGKSYYMGGNSSEAALIFSDCYKKYPESYSGQQALFYSGYIRLAEGSFYYAMKMFQEYKFVYKNGDFYEDSVFNICLAEILAENYSDAQSALAAYRKQFPEGRYGQEADLLAARITEEQNRPYKSPWIAGISSAVVPGLGYFYTEKYLLGLFAMLSNGALIYLAYDGYRDGNMFKMVVFSVVEFSFYNWSLGGSIMSAREYNDNREFRKEIQLHIKRPF
jgi:tetratricopeptide (TPR) repeat protein